MARAQQRFSGPDACTKAVQKARYGHRDWVVWRDRHGILQSGVSDYATFKAAMLAVGTQGRFTVVAGSSAVGHTINWRIGVNWLANIKRGYA
jgi:hypothetical protein